MYARLLATVCLLNVGAVAETSGRWIEGSDDVDVYLRSPNVISRSAAEAMRKETGALMRAGGYRVQWLDAPREVTAGFLIVLELEGRCDALAPTPVGLPVRRLASTAVDNGLVLPFINLDCAALQRFLGIPLRSKPKADAEFLYGRALGRLLAHELYHVVGQTAGHTRTGVTRPAVSVSDLISDQCSFGQEALFRLRRIQDPPKLARAE